MDIVCAGCGLDSADDDGRTDRREDAGGDYGGGCKAGYDICHTTSSAGTESETAHHQLKNHEHEGNDVEDLGPFAQSVEGVERGADFLWKRYVLT